jgi:hypothetical protein
MNKYTIGAIVLVVVFLIGFSVMSSNMGDGSSNLASSGPSASKIVVLEQPYDFGDIEIFAGKVDTTYTLKNEGTEPVTITKAGTSCMCTEGEIAGLTFGMHGSEVDSVTIPAGGEEKVKAIYDPLAHGPSGVGPVTRMLQLETNSTETPEIELRFSANVIKTEG